MLLRYYGQDPAGWTWSEFRARQKGLGKLEELTAPKDAKDVVLEDAKAREQDRIEAQRQKDKLT